MRKGGRPKKAIPRTVKYTIYLTDKEMRVAKKRAEFCNMPVSEYFRDIGTSKDFKVVPSINTEDYEKLARLHSHFNQYMKQLNTNGLKNSDQYEKLEDMYKILKEIRLGLLGIEC
jgi:hypothetical protein